MKSRCARTDRVKNKKEEGWFSKLTIDHDLFMSGNTRFYGGFGLFYTKFESSGFNSYTKELLSKTGDIFAAGLELGAFFKVNDFIHLDFGGQAFFYKGDHNQVGLVCQGTIPGVGQPGSPTGTLYLYIFFGK